MPPSCTSPEGLRLYGIEVEVSDDGRGFDPARMSAGTGTRGMRERARALGGELMISSKPDGGTRVRFEMPAVGDGGSPGETRAGKARILVVDDHASFRQGVAAALEGEPGLSIVGQAEEGGRVPAHQGSQDQAMKAPAFLQTLKSIWIYSTSLNMHSRNIVIDTITKVEGSAGLKVLIEDDAVKDLRFMIRDYRRFFYDPCMSCATNFLKIDWTRE